MSRQRRPQGRHPKKEKRPPTRQFWGEAPPPVEPADLEASVNPTAMVRSLGPPPLGSHSGVALHYFDAVYEKAAALAGALATATLLLDVGHPDDAIDADGDDGEVDEVDEADPAA